VATTTNNDRSLHKSDFSSDRRGEERIRHTRHIRLLPCVARSQWSFKDAELTDCSTRGIALVVTEPITPGEQFRLISLAVGEQTVAILTRADWTQTPSVPEFESLIQQGHRVIDTVRF
jgi:hypothetical protein